MGCAAVDGISLAGEEVSRCSLPFCSFQSSSHQVLLEFGWTQTHSYFAIMGGFLYKLNRDDPDARAVFAPPYYHPLKTLIRRRKITLTEAEIQDRSKCDVISKGLVLLQTSWFVIQIFARINQRLPITELELVTLAYAVLNFAIYFFWWNKPQNLNCPVRVHADELGDLPEIESETAVPTSADKLDDPLSTLPPWGPVTVERELRSLSSDVVGLRMSFTLIVVNAVQWDENNFYPVICTYPGQLSLRGRLRAFMFASGLAAVFGVMHAAAWSFDFPSSAERTVWRTFAMVLVGVPVCSSLLSLHLHRNRVTLRVKSSEFGLLTAIPQTWVMFLLILVYIVSRLVLLVLMFVLLRKVPPGVYETVSWTNYIPHF